MKRTAAFPLTLCMLAMLGWFLARSSQTQAVEAPPAQKTDEANAPNPEAEPKQVDAEGDVTQGALRFLAKSGLTVECPLKHTDVQADVSGFIARTKVTQTFQNPSKEKIEAVYVFPLPHEAAVDDMTMVIGDRKIVGLIKRRAQARSIYEAALMSGQTAALLEQERPNIFTQSVGNIPPGGEVKIEIAYVDVLNYDQGSYEFRFPMVVGPRYNPGQPTSSPGAKPAELEGKTAPLTANTDRVPDASRINPPVLKPGFRTGHDISFKLTLDAGVPVQALKVANHEADVKHDGAKATVTLSPSDSLPNKDFVVRYDVVGEKPEMALLAHTGDYIDTKAIGNGYFMLMVQPKEDERLTKSPPREVVFLVDVSGSMSGEPTAKTIEAMNHMLQLCREKDTVQVITFASQAQKLFEKPVPVNKANIDKALRFTEGLQGGGGTEMLTGVKLAIDEPIDNERLRIIIMLTDGYIGNEAEIIEHVGKNCGDQIRFWCVGMGQSPNSFLVDGVAKQGGGMGKNLGLKDDSSALSQEIMTRIQRAQLSKISIDWGDLKVSETYPAKIPELWAGRPVILHGRFKASDTPTESTVKVSGMIEGEPAEWPLTVSLPAKQPEHDVLAKVWARKKIENLMQQDFYQNSPAIEEIVTGIALNYRLMSQYTSFVAVDAAQAEKLTDEPAKPPRRMLVPVPLPEGTRYEGFFGPAYESEVDDVNRHVWFDAVSEPEALSVDLYSFGRPLSESATRGGRTSLRRRSQALGDRASITALSLGTAARPAPAAMPALAAGVAPVDARGYVRGGQLAQLSKADKFSRGRFGDSSGAAFGGRMRGISPAGGAQYHAGHHFMLTDESFGLAELDGVQLLGRNFGGEALQGQAGQVAQAGQKAIEAAEKLSQEKQAAAREQYLRAYFLDRVAASFGQSSGEVAQKALAALQEIRASEIEAWQKSLPALEKKLDLVIRNQSLADAIEMIAEKSGVKVSLADGAIDDAKGLLVQDELRVKFLDLRGATLTQALDWLLLPVRMNWHVKADTIAASTDRRGEGASAWVYDVSLVAIPSAEEVGKDADPEKTAKLMQESAEEFIVAVRDHLKADEQSVVWYGPGQLLVIADRATHKAAAALIDALANADAKLNGKSKELQAKTSKRAEQSKERVVKQQAARRLLETAAAHEAFGWQLLSAAVRGSVDLESLTHLQIAWHDPETKKLLEGNGHTVAMRSWWIVSQAAAALPDSKELQELARHAASQAKKHGQTALDAWKEKPDNYSAFFGALYGALAEGEDSELAGKLVELIRAANAAGESSNDQLLPAKKVALALLAERKEINREALKGLLSLTVAGDDMMVLTALACRRAGGDVWEAFRAAQTDLVGGQPLDGNVVVLINTLDATILTAAR